MKTVTALYSSLAEANQVKSALQAKGYEAARIRLINQGSDGNAVDAHDDLPFTEKIKNFFTGMDGHDDDHSAYAKRIAGGNALLAVTVPDDEADETAELLSSHGAMAIQDDHAAAGMVDRSSWEGDRKGYSAGTVAEEEVIPVVQENLVVGKRQVDRGGVRIYSHVVETPVSANVSLHDERVVVERRPVDRAAVDSDFAAGTGAIEVTAVGEEAVVGKTSRVVEEVRVAKQASERTEQIHDTVRRTEVEVEPTTADTLKR